jgi:hypothetical protein
LVVVQGCLGSSLRWFGVHPRGGSVVV